MLVKSCLHISIELGLPDQHTEIAKELLKQGKMVTRATTHSRAINLSASALTLVMSGSLSNGIVNDKDARRLVLAGTSLLADYFPLLCKKTRRAIHKRHPTLACCVRRVIRMVCRKCGSSCRHLVRIACVVAVVLTDREQIIGPNTVITGVARAINMNR